MRTQHKQPINKIIKQTTYVNTYEKDSWTNKKYYQNSQKSFLPESHRQVVKNTFKLQLYNRLIIAQIQQKSKSSTKMIQEVSKASKQKIHSNLSKWIQKHVYNCFNCSEKDYLFVNNTIESLRKFQQRHLLKYSQECTKLLNSQLLKQKNLQIISKNHNPHYKNQIKYLQQYQPDPSKLYLAETFSKFCKTQKLIEFNSKGLCQLALLVFMFSFKITLIQLGEKTSAQKLLEEAQLKSLKQIKKWIQYRQSYKKDDKNQIQKERKKIVEEFFLQVYSQKLKIKEVVQGQDKKNPVVRNFLSYFLSINVFEKLTSKVQKADFKAKYQKMKQKLQKIIIKQTDFKTQLCSLCNQFWNQVKDPKQESLVKQYKISDFKNIQWDHDFLKLQKNQRYYVQVPNRFQIKEKLEKHFQKKIKMIQNQQPKDKNKKKIDKIKQYQKPLFKIALEKTKEINQQSTQCNGLYDQIKKKICEDQRTIKIFPKIESKNNKKQVKYQGQINKEDSQNGKQIRSNILVGNPNQIIVPKMFSSSINIQQSSQVFQNHSSMDIQYFMQVLQNPSQKLICEDQKTIQKLQEKDNEMQLKNQSQMNEEDDQNENPQEQSSQFSLQCNQLHEQQICNSYKPNFQGINRCQSDQKMEEQCKFSQNKSSDQNFQMMDISEHEIQNEQQDLFTKLIQQQKITSPFYNIYNIDRQLGEKTN